MSQSDTPPETPGPTDLHATPGPRPGVPPGTADLARWGRGTPAQQAQRARCLRPFPPGQAGNRGPSPRRWLPREVRAELARADAAELGRIVARLARAAVREWLLHGRWM